jgi:hypothetical protein
VVYNQIRVGSISRKSNNQWERKQAYQNDDSETTGWKEQVDPRLDLTDLHIESWGNYTSLVQSTVELDNDLAGTMIIDEFELADVAWVYARKKVSERREKGVRMRIEGTRKAKIVTMSTSHQTKKANYNTQGMTGVVFKVFGMSEH